MSYDGGKELKSVKTNPQAILSTPEQVINYPLPKNDEMGRYKYVEMLDMAITIIWFSGPKTISANMFFSDWI